MTPVWYRVRHVRGVTQDTFSLHLTPSNGGPAISFQPGQFNMLYVYGVGEVPISISSDTARSDLIVHTTRVAGTVTRAMARLRRGGLIGVRGPFGVGWPVHEAVNKDVLIVAGGIGLAPLRPVIYHLLRQRGDYNRVVLLYGARTPDDILYRDEVKSWRGRWDMDVDVTVDQGIGRWRGNVGVVTTLIPRAPYDPDNMIAMVCGPEIMMRFTVQALRMRAVQMDRIYVSMERNMKCAVGLCGHCQSGPNFVCKDGPVFRYDKIAPFFRIREL